MRLQKIYSSLMPAVGVSALLIAGSCGVASAQQSTSATYSDWVLQCVNSGSPPKKICDIAQVTQVRGKNIKFSRVAIESAPKGKPEKLTIQLPVNVSVRDPIEIQIPGTPSSTLSGTFDRCVPVGCFASVQLRDDILKKLNANEGTGKVTFKDAAGRELAFPLSFKGFHQAFDALSKMGPAR